MRRPARLGLALLLAAAVAGCGSDDEVARTYTGVAPAPCEALGTAELVAAAYPGLTGAEPTARVEDGDDEKVATCSLETTADGAPATGLPGQVTVAVTVSVLGQGDPASDFSRLSDYADGLLDPGTTDDVRESSPDLGEGWWSRATSWQTSWREGGSTPEQVVETAAASRDNLLVSVLVVERDLAEGSLDAARERIHRLVADQLDVASDAATS